MLKGDRGGKLDEVGIKDAKAGDIAIFRLTQEMIDAEPDEYRQSDLGAIIHSAIRNEDGTYSTKNGRGSPVDTKASLESLQELYGNNLSFVKPAENINLETLKEDRGWKGIANYSEKEVLEALAKHKKDTKTSETSKTPENIGTPEATPKKKK